MNSRFNKLCTRRMCRRHCLAAGGCKCPGHQEPDNTEIPPALRPHSRLRTYQQHQHQAEQASLSTTPRPFATNANVKQTNDALGLRSPSPNISLEAALLQQEANDLAEVIHQSKLPRHKPFTGVLAVLSSPPPTPANTLRALSSSPDFPQSITITCTSQAPQSVAAIITKPAGVTLRFIPVIFAKEGQPACKIPSRIPSHR
ncbi:hypothetical protein DFH07DRAFT_964524 [Mycena maculata]|uniref:Uncharacterized protein n=1 Tax=Mycena maculata TaxID=230809 RepID=A0AAD7N280_9AGAR|nr:hypothetical protein DFH07DRAFT_964524 [Mycena maculata]